jgi:hypothetical protein
MSSKKHSKDSGAKSPPPSSSGANMKSPVMYDALHMKVEDPRDAIKGLLRSDMPREKLNEPQKRTNVERLNANFMKSPSKESEVKPNVIDKLNSPENTDRASKSTDDSSADKSSSSQQKETLKVKIPKKEEFIQYKYSSELSTFERCLLFINILIFLGILFTCFIFFRVLLAVHFDELAPIISNFLPHN